MANIQNELNNIKNAVFGKDVRNAIHDAIKTCYDDASIVNDNANMEVKIARGVYDTLGDRLNEVDSQLEHKVNKGEITSSDLKTSSDNDKIQMINLSSEVIETLSNPLKKTIYYPNGGFQTGADTTGDITQTSSKTLICNTNLIDLTKGMKIKVKTNFSNRILISCYINGVWNRIIDFSAYGEGYLPIPNDITHIRLTVQHYPDDTTEFNPTTDIVEVYQGGGELYYSFADNSVTTEKLADNSVTSRKLIDNDIDNIKLLEPISKVIAWEKPFIITTNTNIGDKEVKLKGVFVVTENLNGYLNLNETTYTIKDGEYLVLDFKSKLITSEKASSFIRNGYKYILFSNFAGKLQSPIPMYQFELSNIYNKTNLKPKGVIKVAKSGGDYTTITEALNNASDSNDNPVTILVYPGTYNESVMVGGSRNVSIVGVNKLTCILRDDTGVYENAPLEIQGNAYISNMTIISTHDNDTSTPVDSLRSYAAHVDYAGEGVCEFNNCILISKQNAAIGSGLHTNQTLKIIDCELYSETPRESSMTVNGALFVHDGQDAINQKLIVKNSIIKSVNGCSHYLNSHYKTPMIASYYNNVFYSDELGIDSISKDTPTTGISGSIKLSQDSFGNNTSMINA